MRVNVIYDRQYVNSTNGDYLPIAVVKNKKEFNEYVQMRLIADHFNHYQRWCECRNYQVESTNNWMEYIDSCISDEELDRYVTAKKTLSRKEIRRFLRVSVGYIPLGCSFEYPDELENFLKCVEEEKESGEQ